LLPAPCLRTVNTYIHRRLQQKNAAKHRILQEFGRYSKNLCIKTVPEEVFYGKGADFSNFDFAF
jgi:hypothetical protein